MNCADGGLSDALMAEGYAVASWPLLSRLSSIVFLCFSRLDSLRLRFDVSCFFKSSFLILISSSLAFKLYIYI